MPNDENSPRDPAQLDDHERQILADVERVGWHIVIIEEDEIGPAYAFTVGLYHSFGHPEIAIVGLPYEVMEGVLNDLGTDIQSRAAFDADRRYPGLLEGPYDCVFVEVPQTAYVENLGAALWYYRDRPFPTLQCLWPDKNNLTPLDDDFDSRLRSRQPMMA